MPASCNVKINTINKFRDLKLLSENSMKIISPKEFDFYNQKYSDLAKKEYDINTNELLFYVEKEEKQKSYIERLPYYRLPDTEIMRLAFPNENFFEVLQARFYDKKNLEELIDIEYKKSLKDGILYTGPFNKVQLEKINDDPEISQVNEEKEKNRIKDILSNNKQITKSFLDTMYNLGEKNVYTPQNEMMIADMYYEYVRNFPQEQSTENFNKFVIGKIIEMKKQKSKSVKNTDIIKTNTSFPDINLEC
jgi:hypothetical protein